MTLAVKLYIKPGCHLCEQALAELDRLRRPYPHTLERVDISRDDGLMDRYGEQIPVVLIGDREYAAPLVAAELERALAEASQVSGRAGELEQADGEAVVGRDRASAEAAAERDRALAETITESDRAPAETITESDRAPAETLTDSDRAPAESAAKLQRAVPDARKSRGRT